MFLCKQKFFFIMLFILQMCIACHQYEQHEYHYTVKKKAQIVVTDKISSSIIALPNGVQQEYKIINSQQELESYIPASILNSDSIYSNIDFDVNSVVSVKFIFYCEPKQIDYVIKEADGKVSIYETVSKYGDFNVNGYFVMTGILTDKLPDDVDVSIWQSSLN